ncbi:MAG: hypothetical protein GOU99_03640 [Candidatus Altiarchaeota archaeon]|nr:hypothetical protein [Candidatus Altiarchaeota archaeon]
MATEIAANTTFNMTTAVKQLLEVGFFNFILPFGIFFIILYGVLDRFSIISKEKRVNATAAMLISAFILLYVYLNEGVAEWFSLFYMKISITVLIMVFALTFAVFFYRTLKENQIIPVGSEKAYSAAAIIGAVLLMQTLMSSAPGALGDIAQEVSGIVMIFGFLAAVGSFFMKDGGGED